MKKFKTCKEILINPHFKRLAFELLREEVVCEEDYLFSNEEQVELKVTNFIERKLIQCKNEGV